MKKLINKDFHLGLDDSNKLPSYQAIYERLRMYEYRMKVYAIEVVSLGGLYPTTKVSMECYTEISEAQTFCESRGDKPEKINDFKYKSKEYVYNILELNVV